MIGICDRVLVMREGHLVGEVGGASGQADHAGKHHGLRRRRRGLTTPTLTRRLSGGTQ